MSLFFDLFRLVKRFLNVILRLRIFSALRIHWHLLLLRRLLLHQLWVFLDRPILIPTFTIQTLSFPNHCLHLLNFPLLLLLLLLLLLPPPPPSLNLLQPLPVL